MTEWLYERARPRLIGPEAVPVLGDWLDSARPTQIRVRPEPGGIMGVRYAVEVGGEHTDWEAECAVLARCNTEGEAELVAAALWALVAAREARRP